MRWPHLLPRFRPLKRNPAPSHFDWQWSGTLKNGVYVVVSYLGLESAYKGKHPGRPWEVEVTVDHATRLRYFATAREVRACIKRCREPLAPKGVDHQPHHAQFQIKYPKEIP